jgi:HPr kinase/phosphorylase
MQRSLSVATFYDRYGDALGLRWLAGKSGDIRTIEIQSHAANHLPSRTLVGNLNLEYPNQIQIVGDAELDRLLSLDEDEYRSILERLFSLEPAAMIFSGDCAVPAEIMDLAHRDASPLFSSELAGEQLVEQLSELLAEYPCDEMTVHGVFMEVMGTGILLVGESGIGKSELALELVSRGHRLIADDAPCLIRSSQGWLLGSCPAGLQDFLEVRGLGILNVRAMFGDSAVKHTKKLSLTIRLEQMSSDQLASVDRLTGEKSFTELLGLEIPQVMIPVVAGRNLAVLVEAAVRNFALSGKGYDAVADLTARQQALINDRTGK